MPLAPGTVTDVHVFFVLILLVASANQWTAHADHEQTYFASLAKFAIHNKMGSLLA